MSTSHGWHNRQSKDFYSDVQEGKIPGHSLVHKFGRNQAVPNGSFEMVSLLSIPTAFLSAATTVRIKAGGDAADTAAGAGARSVFVQGIDDNLAVLTEEIATAGASASSVTTALFWRVFRAWTTSGTYGTANTAAITIENGTGGTDLLVIGLEEGQSQHGSYTIPLAHTGYLLSATLTVDSNKPADIKLVMRESFNDTSAPMPSSRLKIYWDGVVGELIFTPRTPGPAIPALTDVWWEAEGSGAITEVSVDFEIHLVQDGF